MQQKRKLVGYVTPPAKDEPVDDPIRPRCGAHSKRTGRPCRNWAMKNGRCRMHGGKSTGPKDKAKQAAAQAGNENSRSHGLYADGLHADEFDLYGTIEIGNLKDEIKMTRVLLKRAFRAQLAWELARGELNRADDATVKDAMIGSGLFNVDELSTEVGIAGVTKEGDIVDIDKNRIVRRKTSFADEIRHYQRLLTKLEETHARLQEGAGDEDMVARLAEDLRTFTDNAGPLMPGGEL